MKNVLIIKKENEARASEFMFQLAKFIKSLDSNVKVFNLAKEAKKTAKGKADCFLETLDYDEYLRIKASIDLVVTVGGDGTMLSSSTLFGNGELPIVLPFSMGTLGFLTTFDPSEYNRVLEQIIRQKQANIVERDRLKYSILSDKKTDHKETFIKRGQCINEVILHRGIFSQLVSLDVVVDEKPLTNVLADGLIVATPTGSTAYSLSSGGPIVHPRVKCMLLTPICPRSLSFRPIMLPIDSKIKLIVSEASRGDLYIQVDGKEKGKLKKHEIFEIERSEHSMYCIARNNNLRKFTDTRSEKGEWKDDISKILKWNQSFTRKT